MPGGANVCLVGPHPLQTLRPSETILQPSGEPSSVQKYVCGLSLVLTCGPLQLQFDHAFMRHSQDIDTDHMLEAAY